MWYLSIGITWLVFVVAAIVGWVLWSGRPWWATGLLLAWVLLAVAWTLAVPRLRLRIHRWEVTDEAVYTASGWLALERRVAPINRIQTVDTDRGPLHRALGLSSVTITTASAAGPLTIVGLDAPVAEQIVERLTALTRASRGDGT